MKMHLRDALFLVAVLVGFVQSLPFEGLGELETNEALAGPIGDEMRATEGDGLVRQPRLTCDLLDGFGFGHTPCATHCLALGKAGGRCVESICTCRRTTFGALWRSRFGSLWS